MRPNDEPVCNKVFFIINVQPHLILYSTFIFTNNLRSFTNCRPLIMDIQTHIPKTHFTWVAVIHKEDTFPSDWWRSLVFIIYYNFLAREGGGVKYDNDIVHTSRDTIRGPKSPYIWEIRVCKILLFTWLGSC